MKEAETRERLPPGQVLTHKWPVLTYGETPRADLQTWTFRCFGLVDQELSWTWKEFRPGACSILVKPQEEASVIASAAASL